MEGCATKRWRNMIIGLKLLKKTVENNRNYLVGHQSMDQSVLSAVCLTMRMRQCEQEEDEVKRNETGKK